MFKSSDISGSKSFNPAAAHVKSLQTAHKTTYENNRFVQFEEEDDAGQDPEFNSAFKFERDERPERKSEPERRQEPAKRPDQRDNSGHISSGNGQKKNKKKKNKNRTEKPHRPETPQEAFKNLKVSPNSAENKTDRPGLKDLSRLIEEKEKGNNKEGNQDNSLNH